MKDICALVLAVNPVHLVVLSVAQILLSVLWFKLIVYHFETYYLAADKGVRRVEHALHRYHTLVVLAIDLLSTIIRSLVVIFVLDFCSAQSLQDYQYAAIIASIFSFVSVHRHFAYQRPFQLFVSSWGFEIVASMMVAVMLFFLPKLEF